MFFLSAKREKILSRHIILKRRFLRSEPKPVREISVSMGVPMPEILRKISRKSSGFMHRWVIRTPTGNNYYTSGASDKMSLSQLSKLGEKEGWKKKGWK